MPSGVLDLLVCDTVAAGGRLDLHTQ